MREQRLKRTSVTGHPTMTGRDERYEYLSLTVDPREKPADARTRVAEHAEYGEVGAHALRGALRRGPPLRAAAPDHAGGPHALNGQPLGQSATGPSREVAVAACTDSSSEGWYIPASTSR